MFPCDLKAIQQNIGYGGGTHVCRLFCVYCGVKNYDRAVPSLIACEHCRRLNKPEGYCHHSVFLTSELISFYGSVLDRKRLMRCFNFPVGWTQYTLLQCRAFAVEVCLENPEYIKDMKLSELKNHLRQVESTFVVNYNTVKLLDEMKCNKLLRILGCNEGEIFYYVLMNNNNNLNLILHIVCQMILQFVFKRPQSWTTPFYSTRKEV